MRPADGSSYHENPFWLFNIYFSLLVEENKVSACCCASSGGLFEDILATIKGSEKDLEFAPK